MEIVFLEKSSLGEDIDLSMFDKLGHVTKYDLSSIEETAERVENADVIIVNKIPMNEKTLSRAKNLKLIALTATGTNNIDKEYTKKQGIAVANVAGYSTEAVAQHTFALMFYLLHKMAYYDNFVKSGDYCRCPGFSHFEEKFFELEEKTWGIIGMGAIGRSVAKKAEAFGCRVIYYSTSGRNTDQPYEQVSFDEILRQSDILSIHAPLTPETECLMNKEAFQKMKNTAIMINVARGAIVQEADLAEALQKGEIAGAGLDVLSVEPMREENPLYAIKDSRKLMITPHIGWAPEETRCRLMREVYQNIEAFFQGVSRNRVV